MRGLIAHPNAHAEVRKREMFVRDWEDMNDSLGQ